MTIIHGDATRSRKAKEYIAWANMKIRCYNPKFNQYQDYGGRGIKMCSEWLNSYVTFLSDMGRCPPGCTLDRKNNDGNYEPGNCRWATRRDQGLNKRQKNVCPKGHPLDMIQGKWRRCGTCWREYHRKWESDKRASDRAKEGRFKYERRKV